MLNKMSLKNQSFNALMGLNVSRTRVRNYSTWEEPLDKTVVNIDIR